MGLQLIFVVEANEKSKSDWIYMKDTIERFYQLDQAQIKLSPVYMDGKGRLFIVLIAMIMILKWKLQNF